MSKSSSVVPLQHSLFTSPVPQVPDSPTVSRSSLWACFFFHRLSLEVLRAEVDAVPWVVVHEQRGKQLVYMASQPAREAGVEDGMALTAAYALCPELETEWRDDSAEQVCLTQLAEWAGQYSSMVSLESQALLLEIGASLKLFGGLQVMRKRMQNDLRQQSYAAEVAIAPTPQAALLLTQSGTRECVSDTSALRATLGRLPIGVLPATDKQTTLLIKLGLRNLRDLWRLPREGLIKRFGLEFIDYLDRLLGDKPDLLLFHQASPCFSAHWPFPIETDNMSFILHGMEQLLPRLVRFMQLRELALNRFEIAFYHPEKKASRIELGTRELCRDESHLMLLLRERLEQKQLSAPVLEITLTVSEFHPFCAKNQSLFSQAKEQDVEWQHTLNQLQNRLGEQAVSSLQVIDDHRPEYAWAYGASKDAEIKLNRPLWLLSQPQKLRDGLTGIKLISEKERIEGGWWDGFDIQRDYYRARDSNGRKLWLFCDLKTGLWYLHGLFG